MLGGLPGVATGSGSTEHPSFRMEGEPYPAWPVAPVTWFVNVKKSRPGVFPANVHVNVHLWRGVQVERAEGLIVPQQRKRAVRTYSRIRQARSAVAADTVSS